MRSPSVGNGFLSPILILGAIFLCGCSTGRPPPATVASVDVPRYVGRWFEIARFDHWFERDLTATTADYVLRTDGDIDVTNRGHLGQPSGAEKVATARAWVVAPGKLKVRFFWPFTGDYWIIGLDPNYRWAVIGAPHRDYLWLLHREAHPPAVDVARMREIALGAGYDLTPLLLVEHAPSGVQPLPNQPLPK